MDMLELHAGILPMQFLMHKACHWAALRIVLLSGSHSLNSAFHLWVKRYIKMHRSPLHELAHIYKAPPSSVESITLVFFLLGYVPRF